MEFNSKTYNDVLDNYKSGQAWLNDVSVEIEGGEAEIDPLTLLRIYEDKPTVENQFALASGFCLNRRVTFKKDGKEIFGVFYSGGDLSQKFAKAPYLLNVLLQASYGILIKKLTPPLESSETESGL